MKQIYLLDDIRDLNAYLKKIQDWHPKAIIKMTTNAKAAMNLTDADVVVIRKSTNLTRL